MINYYLLTKPGIIFGNLVTVTAGFLLASKGIIHWELLLATLVGLALIIASACVLNNTIDRHLDGKMKRTRKRPLASGAISVPEALFFALILGLAGNGVLWVFTNLLTLAVANAGFGIYVFLYSFLKTETPYATAIGSLAGAVPPVVGYCAVSNRLDAGAVLLFALLVLWQMPHFFSIAILYLDDYAGAGIPVLPVHRGIARTKIHMLFYIVGCFGALVLLCAYGFLGPLSLAITGAITLVWLVLAFRGFRCANDKLWGREMFRVSLVLINAFSLAIIADRFLI